MSGTALKFGPEWLRALTQTNGVSTPPTTGGATKYKLADYRYGREEMLALFDQSAPMPEAFREFQHLAVENTQLPLALVTMTEDEQRIWSRSVNSDAVLRLTVGKGAVPGAGPGRGTRGVSVDRGRGRGRGGTYQRGQNSEDGGESQFGAFIRPRPFERSQSLSERDQRWDDRDKKPDRQFQGRPNFDGDPPAAYRKDGRPAENWRSGHAEDDENWRSKVSAQQPTEKWKSWRNTSKTDEEESSTPNGPARKDTGRHWIEDHGSASSEKLPEWIEEHGDTDKVGIFDGKGGFMETKCSDEENWDEELLTEPCHAEPPKPCREEKETTLKEGTPPSSKVNVAEKLSSLRAMSSQSLKRSEPPKRSTPKPIPTQVAPEPIQPSDTRGDGEDISKSQSPKEDSFAHLAKAAESMMAEWTAEEEKNFVSRSKVGDQSSPEHFYKWLYKDPQGDIQGPFSSSEMMEWFQAGYFTMDLMVKRVCDAAFSKLGALIKHWNIVPFVSIHQPPPLKLPLGTDTCPPPNVGVPHIAHPGISLPPSQIPYSVHHQYVQEAYRAAAMQQIMSGLKTNEAFANMPPIEQNRVCLQYYTASHPLPRPAGFGERTALMNLLGSMGMPSVYGVPSSIPKDGLPNEWLQVPPAPSIASSAEPRGTSVWDTEPSAVVTSIAEPAGTSTESLWRQSVTSQSALAEQFRVKEEEERRLQELRKQEEARLEEERKRAEEEARRQEEQRKLEEKRRLEEEERARLEEERRVEEERKRREEEERQRLEEEKKQREEEERKQREEEERLWQQRLEEEERAEAERKKKLEEEKKAEEKRKQEQAKKAAEEKKKKEKAKEQVVPREDVVVSAKSPSKVSVIDVDEFIALKRSKQPPKPEQAPMPKPEKPQGPVWGGDAGRPPSTLSLAEIQKLQEEKERAAMAERMQQLRKQREAFQAMHVQQQQQPKSATSWASKASSAPVKSLSEIQQEEAERADKLRRAQQKQQRHQEPTYHLPGAWGGTSNNLLKTFSNSFQYLEHASEEDICPGFWDDVVATPASPPKSRNSAFPTSSGASSGERPSTKGLHSKKEEEQVMKLFEAQSKVPTDELTKWCVNVLGGIQSYLDIPTVVAILKDVESPTDVREYVHSFFGNSLDTDDFVRQFLQRREGLQNMASATVETYQVHGPAPVPNAPRDTVSQLSDGFCNARTKKKKKNKMQKMDSSLLGFTVQADPSRVNVGEIDRGDGF